MLENPDLVVHQQARMSPPPDLSGLLAISLVSYGCLFLVSLMSCYNKLVLCRCSTGIYYIRST